MGRFINADAYAATGVGLLGNNMFAYCNNNPVNLMDTTGTLPFGVKPMQVAVNDGGWSNGAYECAAELQKFKQTTEKWKQVLSLFTNDPMEVIQAERFAIYNGTPVIKVPHERQTAFTFGFIFMSDKVQDPNLVRHEYGHSMQMRELGTVGYLYTVVIPSVYSYQRLLSEEINYDTYYSLPWEYVANTYEQVPWGRLPGADTRADAYWQFAKGISAVLDCFF